MSRPIPDAVALVVMEAILDLTPEEADVVLETVRLNFRLTTGPTTNGDAKRMLARLEEAYGSSGSG